MDIKQSVDIENRKLPRIPLNYSISARATTSDLKHLDISGHLVDINEMGLSCELDSLHSISEISSMVLEIGGRSVEADVDLVWSQKLEDASITKFGVRIIADNYDRLLQLKEALWLTSDFQDAQSKIFLGAFMDIANIEHVYEFFKDDIAEYINSVAVIAEEVEANSYSEAVFTHLDSLSKNIVIKGNAIASKINNKHAVRRMKDLFREMIGTWVYRSHIIKWGLDKPRGYAGDHNIIELIYNDLPVSDGLGHYYDRCILASGYAEAVRNRKDVMISILKNIFDDPSNHHLDILNIACGSCREFREIFKLSPELNKTLKIICVDQDSEALGFSEEALGGITNNADFQFINENVLDFSKNPSYYRELFGEQDLVYSIGLADYLPDRVLKRLLKFCFDLLRPGGGLVLAHKDANVDHVAPIAPDWFCDWSFIPRSQEDLIGMFDEARISTTDINVERDPSRRIMFFTLRKHLDN